MVEAATVGSVPSCRKHPNWPWLDSRCVTHTQHIDIWGHVIIGSRWSGHSRVMAAALASTHEMLVVPPSLWQ